MPITSPVHQALAGALQGATHPSAPRLNYAGMSLARGGPLTKLRLLQKHFPEHRRDFNIIYLLSAGRPDFDLVQRAKARGVVVVLNQNGVYYPAVRPDDWSAANADITRMLGLADHVIYQSDYARQAVSRYIAVSSKPGEILHNAVATGVFAPAPRAGERLRWRLLSTGLISNAGRMALFENLLRSLAMLVKRRNDWVFEYAGDFRSSSGTADFRRQVEACVRDLGITERVRLSGGFSGDAAPEVYRRGDIYLHYMYGDTCPNAVLEAMATGLPVVCGSTGGTPELVGTDAGIVVHGAMNWERITPCDPDAYAQAITAAMDNHGALAAAARRRAEEHFDVKAWVARHHTLFSALLGGGR